MLPSILFTLFAVCAVASLVAAQVDTGLYRISNREFFGLIIAQSGSSIGTTGGSVQNDAGVTWYIAPAPSASQTAYTIQNAKSLQYMSISGTPANGSAVVPADTPFAWTLEPGTGFISVDGFAVSTQPGAALFLAPRGSDPSLQWIFGGVQPFPATYRIWNTATNTYLTGSATLPGPLIATASDVQNALQYWTVAGTAPDSLEGTLANVRTGGYITISNGTLGTFSTTKPPAPEAWQFTVVGGGDRLSYFGAPTPNVIALDANDQVILDVADSGNPQVFVFVPADPSNAL